MCYNVSTLNIEWSVKCMNIVLTEDEKEKAFAEIVRGLIALGYTADDKAEIASLFTIILSSDKTHKASNTADL